MIFSKSLPSIAIRHFGKVPLDPLGDKPQAFAVLADGCQALVEIPGRFFLADGTLLGLVRDGGIIPHDSDLDVFTLGMDAGRVIWALQDAGFTHVRTMTIDNRPAQLCFVKDEVLFDVQELIDKDEHYVLQTEHGQLFFDKTLIDPLRPYANGGLKAYLPSDTDGYFTYRYGADWRIPKTEKTPWEGETEALVPWGKESK